MRTALRRISNKLQISSGAELQTLHYFGHLEAPQSSM